MHGEYYTEKDMFEDRGLELLEAEKKQHTWMKEHGLPITDFDVVSLTQLQHYADTGEYVTKVQTRQIYNLK